MNRKKIKLLALAGILGSSLIFSSCLINPLVGGLYSDWKVHMGDHQQEIGSKQAETCVTNILGLIATGDASALEAAKKAGIKKITSIDYKVSNILGLYGTYCIVVTGE
jgi:UDP-N-acetylglucosamine transferase subunit ALG13